MNGGLRITDSASVIRKLDTATVSSCRQTELSLDSEDRNTKRRQEPDSGSVISGPPMHFLNPVTDYVYIPLLF
ncbi:hypothetical protein VZT92_003531 [Zoarces viviparus]|uniref:Uncharacterized protein n=1 Tax=Zoarces viviparus TaxID=48416 RepID=A0AAW1FUF9_ZOAVI